MSYENVDDLAEVLESHQIHTVISALALHIHGVGAAQMNLIKAADKTLATKRFVVSSWAVRPSEELVMLDPQWRDVG